MIIVMLPLKPDHLDWPEVDDVGPPRCIGQVGARVVQGPACVDRTSSSL